MDKKILEDYIDACEFIKETEAEIKKLKKKRKTVIDKVRGKQSGLSVPATELRDRGDYDNIRRRGSDQE